jgi:adenylate cyclase
VPKFLASFVFALFLAGVEIFVFTFSPSRESGGQAGGGAMSLGERLEFAVGDLWFRFRGTVPAPKDIVLLSMDEQSYRALGVPLDQPWPRAKHAQMLENLARLGAKRVLLDIIFAGPGPDKEADQRLEEALRRVPTVIGVDAGSDLQNVGESKIRLEEVIMPYQPFAEAAEQLALVRMPEDDGFIRRFKFPRSSLNESLPSLYEAALGKPAPRHAIGERDLLWYYGPPRTITTYSYQLALDQERTPPGFFKDKIVFVGLNLRTGLGPASKDSFQTPLHESPMFGVEIQATAAANLLEGKWLKRGPKIDEISFLAVLTFVLAQLVFRVRPQWGMLFVAGSVFGWGAGAYLSFLAGFFLPGATVVGIMLPISYGVSTAAYYLITYRAQQHVEKAFRLYLPPQMARAMRTNQKALELGGEEVQGTALFSDIAGFTEIAETMGATDVAHMLNAYFTEIVSVIFAHQGTVVKFIGDAVFVIWGAPIHLPNHAQLGCETALAMRRAIESFNSTKRFPLLTTRIGLHTGSMLVGNLGASIRFDYTAIGDTVNTASRLEGANKYFGTSIIISGSTRAELTGSLSPVELGSIYAVGKKSSLSVFTLFEEPLADEMRKLWADSLTGFRERNWQAAQAGFSGIRAKESRLEKAARVYLSQLANYLQEPPPQEWAGEILLSQK